jgi:hypothetical protein
MIPLDLEDFYRSIFDAMVPMYRNEAARIFYVVAEAAEIQTYGPLSILQLWYSLEQGLQASIRAKRKQILAKERQSMTEMLNRRLHSRTKGLVEIAYKSADDFTGSSSLDGPIAFLHKTVADFLLQPETATKVGLESHPRSFRLSLRT